MTEPEVTTTRDEHGNAVLDVPTQGGQKRSERLLGSWKGIFPDLSLEEFRQLRDEWSREAGDELDEFEREDRNVGDE